MTDDRLDMMAYLKSNDVGTLPKRRGREASTFYPHLVEAFMSSREEAMTVDVARIGRKAETVRSALAKAIRSGQLEDRVRVSLIQQEVILRRR